MSEDKLKRIDEIKKRINVTHKIASDALDEAGNDVLNAVIKLEEKYPETIESLKNTAQETLDNLKESPSVILTKDGKELIRIPVLFGAFLAYGAFKKPKFTIAALGLGMISGIDLSFKYKEDVLSLRETLKINTKKASESIQKTRAELENKIFESKDKSFLKEDKSGDRYHTIKL